MAAATAIIGTSLAVGSSGMSFLQASKQAKAQKKAEQAAEDAMKDANHHKVDRDGLHEHVKDVRHMRQAYRLIRSEHVDGAGGGHQSLGRRLLRRGDQHAADEGKCRARVQSAVHEFLRLLVVLLVIAMVELAVEVRIEIRNGEQQVHTLDPVRVRQRAIKGAGQQRRAVVQNGTKHPEAVPDDRATHARGRWLGECQLLQLGMGGLDHGPPVTLFYVSTLPESHDLHGYD